MKVVDLSGQTFGALFVIRKDAEATKKNKRGTYWCKCSVCNEEKLISSSIFRRKKPIESCGCKKVSVKNSDKTKKPELPSPPQLEHRSTQKIEARLLRYARLNAKKLKKRINLNIRDIVIPEYCPVFGIKLNPSGHVYEDEYPYIDMIDPTKDYTKDNICIFSIRASRIRNGATLEEIKMLYDTLKLLTEN